MADDELVFKNMDNDDYETLPPETTWSTHMVAGAFAGVMEHCVMYPVDCVKTRMQCLVPNPQQNYRNVGDALYKIVRYEGIGNTVRGINAMVGGAAPAHALYFACYEKLKRVISGTQHGTPFANGVAGCAATLLHDAVMNPADVVKQRMQMFCSPYKNCTDCAKTILKEEGLQAFYRSYTTQLSMNIPFQSIHFVTYELMQDYLNKDREYRPGSHMVSGAFAGAVAAAITTPLDVCKTLLNTQERCCRSEQRAISGISEAFRTVYHFQGLPGYFRGLGARVIYQMPSTAISWSVYEFFKYYITKHNNQDDAYYSVVAVSALDSKSS